MEQRTKVIMKHVGIGSAMGYNNAIKLLNDACKTMYSGVNASAKNLSFADIEGKISGMHFTSNAKTLTNEDVDIPIKCQTNAEAQAFLNGDRSALSVQDNFIISGPRVTANGITLNDTYVYIYWDWETYNPEDSIYKEFLNCTGEDMYWMSSVCQSVSSSAISFGVYTWHSGGICCEWLYNGTGRWKV